MPSERIAIHHIAGILRLRHEAGRSPAGDRQRLRNRAACRRCWRAKAARMGWPLPVKTPIPTTRSALPC